MLAVKDALKHLKKDKIKNLSIINVLENNPNSILDIKKIDNTILVKSKSDAEWIYISSPNEKELIKMNAKLNENDKSFASIENWMVPSIIKNHKVKWEVTTFRFFLPDDISLPEPKNHIRPLSIKDAEIVNEYWEHKSKTSIFYIKDRIEKDIGSGIEVNNKLVAWGMTHDDGAMGFLYVLKEHRRKGYAKDVLFSLTKKLRQRKKIPFAYIMCDNEKSISLTTSLGFVKDRKCSWFEIY